MSIQIEVSDTLFNRLKRHTTSRETTALVIERLVDYFESSAPVNNKRIQPDLEVVDLAIKKFNATQPPDLFHTRSRGTFGSIAFSNWNELVRIAHVEAFAKAKSFELLRAVTQAQIRKGSHSDSGYHFLPEINISVQGVDANHAWAYSLRLAQYVKVPLRASVEWRNNEKASHPGTSGLLEWKP